MSLLTLVQSFCKRTNISVPTAVVGSGNEQVQQILGLLEEEGEDLSQRIDWQVLTNEATLSTLAAESQGNIQTIAPGFSRFKPETFWDRNLRLPVYVIGNADWQQVKAINVTGPRYQARIRGDLLISNPAPPASHTWAFEYISRYWITDSAGLNPSESFNADTDLILLPEKIVKMGLRWRWKKEKGFDYDEDFQTYEKMIAKQAGSDGLKRRVNMAESPMIMQNPASPRGYRQV